MYPTHSPNCECGLCLSFPLPDCRDGSHRFYFGTYAVESRHRLSCESTAAITARTNVILPVPFLPYRRHSWTPGNIPGDLAASPLRVRFRRDNGKHIAGFRNRPRTDQSDFRFDQFGAILPMKPLTFLSFGNPKGTSDTNSIILSLSTY